MLPEECGAQKADIQNQSLVAGVFFLFFFFSCKRLNYACYLRIVSTGEVAALHEFVRDIGHKADDNISVSKQGSEVR